MSDGTKMDFNFADLKLPDTPVAPKADLIRGAAEAGRAEGYNSRVPAQEKPAAHSELTIQFNVKVPVSVRERFLAAVAAEKRKDRAIRSGGELFTKMFEEWEARNVGR